jgi:hypothetical protein
VVSGEGEKEVFSKGEEIRRKKEINRKISEQIDKEFSKIIDIDLVRIVLVDSRDWEEQENIFLINYKFITTSH